MSSPLASLEPSVLWKHFDALRCIPRPSGHEEAVMAHLRSWAEARGLDASRRRRRQPGHLCARHQGPGEGPRRHPPGPRGHGRREGQIHRLRLPQGPDRGRRRRRLGHRAEDHARRGQRHRRGGRAGGRRRHGRLPRPARAALHRGRGDRFDGGDERRAGACSRAGQCSTWIPRKTGRCS